MRSAKWLAFGLSNKQTRTLVHFFPSAGNVTAPYPVNCKLSVFGPWDGKKSLTIEGARLSQADGIRVEEVFPDYIGGPDSGEGQEGAYGLEIELSIFQPGIDISASSCIVELQSQTSTASYRASPMRVLDQSSAKDTKSREMSEEIVAEGEDEKQNIASFIAVHDAYHTSSLVVLNSGSGKFVPALLERGFENNEEALMPFPHSLELAPVSLVEHRFNAEDFAKVEPVECSFGLFRAKQLYLRQGAASDSIMYALYRDKVSNQPISVSAI